MTAFPKAHYLQGDLAAAKLATLLCYPGVRSRDAQSPPTFLPRSTVWIFSSSERSSLQLRKRPQGGREQQKVQLGLLCGADSAQRGRVSRGWRTGNPCVLQPSCPKERQAGSPGVSPSAVHTVSSRHCMLASLSQTVINPFDR